MIRHYLSIDVYEAFQNRMEYIFQEFENIYISFSGGKDSGLLLNLVLDYVKNHNLNRRIGVFHQDFGMDTDEVLRLKQITGLAALFKETKFGRAWIPEDESAFSTDEYDDEKDFQTV